MGFVPSKKKTNTHNNSFDSIENDENIKKGDMGDEDYNKFELSDMSDTEGSGTDGLEGITEANEEDEFSSIRGERRRPILSASRKNKGQKSQSKFKPPSLSDSESEDLEEGTESGGEGAGEGKSTKHNQSAMIIFHSGIYFDLRVLVWGLVWDLRGLGKNEKEGNCGM